MKNIIDVERMIELEKMVENNEIEFPITYKEYIYIERARKIPFKYMVEFITLLKNNRPWISKKDVVNTLMNLISCSDEIMDRYNEVNEILNYKNDKLNEMVKEQKQMVKKINEN